MSDVLVSVIIPVFNGEKYLEECIKSLINQTLKNCEFIFINDGSTDSSKEIIEKYKLLDSRIKLINQENQGVSVARNNGLEQAQGEFIGFVDADDYIESEMYERLYFKLKETDSDFIMCNFNTTVDGHSKTSKYPYQDGNIMSKEYIIENILYKMISNGSLYAIWNKLYKKELINKYNIRFILEMIYIYII